MNFNKNNMLLYAVTDSRYEGKKNIYQLVEESLKGGVTMVQLREKNLDYDHFLEKAINLKKICSKYNVPLIINDNVEIAIKSNADGVHVGQSDMEAENVRKLVGDNMIIGVSAGSYEEAIAAEKAGANYLGIGAIYNTNTKKDADVISIDEIKKITNAVSIPTCAIGGLNEDNIMNLKGLGLDGVALVSAIFSKENIELSSKKLLEISKNMVKND